MPRPRKHNPPTQAEIDAKEAKIEAECIEATKGSKGIVSVIQERLEVSRAQVYVLLDRYPAFKQAREEEQEKRKDKAELVIHDMVTGYWAIDENSEPDKDGNKRRIWIPPNPTMVIFYAKTQMRDRGYSEHIEHTGENGQPIPIRVIFDDSVK